MPLPGWKELIVCDGVTVPCTFEKFMELIKNGITDLVIISTFLAIIVFVWVGFKLMTSGGNEKAWTDAKGMLWKVVLGYLWILAAWLVVYTITSVLLNPGYSLLGAPTQN
ncbi:MAG: hypothetical protein HYT69_00970 [Candidatus Zambryskibacteria bacterium]|nr:hypothetical protein [Candidatus Zambryskibacteria bacterium]